MFLWIICPCKEEKNVTAESISNSEFLLLLLSNCNYFLEWKHHNVHKEFAARINSRTVHLCFLVHLSPFTPHSSPSLQFSFMIFKKKVAKARVRYYLSVTLTIPYHTWLHIQHFSCNETENEEKAKTQFYNFPFAVFTPVVLRLIQITTN